MFLKMLFSILAALLITLLGHYYLYFRLIYPIFGMHPFWIIIFICLWIITSFGFIILRFIPNFFRKAFEIVMFIWMGVAFLFTLVCLITSPINIYLKATDHGTIFLCYFVVLSGTILTIYSMFLALKNPEIIKIQIKMKDDLPRSIKKLKFVVLSDIHVSGLIGRKRMGKLTKNVNALDPDIIFITGDLMDGSLNQLKKEIAPLEDLIARYGIYYITGNHEYYSGPQNWKQHFSDKFRWKVISNSSHTVQIDDLFINVLGIEDRHWLSYKKIPRKLDKRLQQAVLHLEQYGAPKEHTLNILLAHQPKDAKLLEQFPFIDLQISGHTHGGQIWPLQFIVKKDQKYVKGLYQINEKQQIYVNQGTGFWGPPMRLGTNCEITLMTFI